MREYIYDNVGRFIALNESGHLLTARCPFHSEVTPSFTVNPANNTYHCFGCDAHGHIEDFEAAFKARSVSPSAGSAEA